MSRRKHHSIGSYFIAVAVLAVVVWTAVVATGGDERVCASCHDTTVGSPSPVAEHASARCADCHAPSGSALFWVTDVPGMVVVSALGGAPSGPVVETEPDACLRCHDEVMAGVSAGLSGIRISHDPCALGVASCDVCHSTTAHGAAVRSVRLAVMEDCTSCHIAAGAGVECEVCHAKDVDIATRLETGPWQVTHGPNWRDTHGMGRIDTCSTCHPADYCVRCHGLALPHPPQFGREHGEQSLSDGAQCVTCHASTAFCNDCHGMEMPHPVGFMESHSSVAVGVDDPSCVTCHAREDCEACHVRHVHPGGSLGVPVPQVGSGTGLEDDR